MNPQGYAPQQPTPNPYDFLNAPSPQKRGIGSNPKQRTLIAVLFVLAVLTVVAVAVAVFLSFSKKDYSPLVNTLYDQTEIIRIADDGVANARTSSTRQFAATILYVTQTEQAQTISTLKKAKQTVNEKTLAARKDTNNDKILAAAKQANNYDDKLVELLNELLDTYHGRIKSVSDLAATATEKNLVTLLSENAAVFIAARSKD